MKTRDLPALFRTKERIILLRAALAMTACTVQQLTVKTGVSKGLVSQYLGLLEREGFLGRTDRTYRVLFSARTLAVKRLLNIDLVAGIFTRPPWALGIGMYGSWAEGTNTAESDLDLWVFSRDLPVGTVVAELGRKLSTELATEVHILVLSREKMAGMKEHDQPFYQLFLRQSVTLDGESPEANG